MPAKYIKRILSARVYDVASETPLEPARFLSQRLNNQVLLKREDLQPVYSFKIRGAMNFVMSTPEADRQRGFVAYSSGNHAQAVAIAARHAGVRATLVMPMDAPQTKLEATRDAGGMVVAYDRYNENREAIGKAIADETGASLIPPFDHPWIVAGQGTAARCGTWIVG